MFDGKKRILCLDDNDDACQLISMVLNDYNVISAHNIADALTLAKTNTFALYLLDYHLPDGTGEELCREIRTFDRATPILFLTASTVMDKSKIEEMGAQGLIIKGKSEFIEKLVKMTSELTDKFSQESKCGNKKRILYVEDHKAFGEMIVLLLNDYEVIVVPKMAKALGMARDEKFLLFLVDQNLPNGVTGVDFCRELRTFDRETPVLFLSVSPDLSEEQIEKVGAQGLLIKGMANFIEQLHENVSRLLGEQLLLET